ncbi:hypothetical protein CC85DRAFT_283123 [Cutaneotrichosporon oleaginosum]|uniref:COP9 signalosome complex subunit 3 n=1 Tax=Cutaneotrichosporon oleaginosum TaxID=879819 RepID=A0A0J1BA86_9TREE|nr:uncharacterized protein CC85DRAFT_283123 [Cutaneotrichosporon oleaginosum]KLT44829.1 hypothetical protein CC85DRAFT_283123 [Cutaneotrichosporon oleaginosum]TXT11968.1 hypothetical protein COLE_02378 [Cutaneotrichosporon oleaginosum]
MVNSEAGPSRPAHPAFPSVAAPSPQNVPVPPSPAHLWKQIQDSSSPQLLSDLAALMDFLAPSKPGNEEAPRELLLLEGIDLTSVSGAQVPAITLGLVYVLTERLNRRTRGADENLELALSVCVNGSSEQLARAPWRVAQFAWAVLRAAQKAKETARALHPLQHLLRLTFNNAYFNGVHAAFLEACLSLRAIDLGYQSLSIIYSNVVAGTSVIDVLTYYHHAGTVAAAHGDFARASELFTFGASIPGETPSAIRIACAKRAILCELLSSGRPAPFPKDMAQATSRSIDKGMEPYKKLSKAFENREWDQASEAVSSNDAVAMFEKDCNRGLVTQIMQSIPKRRILDLRKTYSRLSLQDLASKVMAPADAVKSAIQDMVVRDEIQATINGVPEVVTFVDDDDYASPQQMVKLVQANLLAQNVNNDLLYANRAMLLNRKLLQKKMDRIENKDKRGSIEPLKSRGEFEVPGDDIGQVRGAGSNYADMGF